MYFACASAMLKDYGLTYHVNYLYLIPIGRIILGFAFTYFMYCKPFSSDPRIVGVRQPTTLAGWLRVGQSTGFSVGPFAGGLLYKVGFDNSNFNGYTTPGWIIAAGSCSGSPAPSSEMCTGSGQIPRYHNHKRSYPHLCLRRPRNSIRVFCVCPSIHPYTFARPDHHLQRRVMQKMHVDSQPTNGVLSQMYTDFL
ncbi:hypothetical protein EW146_g6991 [Bondarzewia mesenterica]|uniref:Major facilitator superfamily (MFS) profile domain-containing protein n=1 Tax=Bondarzewia mesenterica TaxID=1095465 RepID=A0A4S4LNY9_9AGAM|nr:hypothetical protein EW146_g6991 [Bondarzewia mesenterica]